MSHRSALLALACLAPLAAPARPPAGGDLVDAAAAARECLALVEAGSTEEARELARTTLEVAPDDPLVLAAAARAEEAAGDADRALWYATLGLEALGASPPEGAADALSAVVARLRPDGLPSAALLARYGESLLEVAKACQRKKLYANAVALLSRCEGTPVAADARAQLDKMFENESIVEALLESGVNIPAKPVTRKSAAWIAKEDAKHADWEDAYEVETKNYTVKTNMGYEMAQSISLAMEQMNRYYRRVFQYKERGGSMRRCVLSVYASRAEFDQQEPGNSETVRGFFVPLENRVATYDPRTDGRSMPELWSTLFHEASHQFTRAISKNPIPAWLNEGTASFFEGAKLLPDGRVAPNGIPDGRLRALLVLLERGRPTLKQVVSYFEPGSYPGDYYPFGWGLVYFIQNYEDDESERTYVPIYRDYIEAYTSGGKHDAFDRWVDYFVTRAKQPGIDSFEAFEERWKAWIRELGQIQYGGPEEADVLLERARKQARNEKPEYAVESYRWALEKRSDDARAWYELAQVLHDLDREDGALDALRRCLELVRAEADASAPVAGFDGETAEEVGAQCIAQIERLDRVVAQGLTEARRGLLDEVAVEARALLADGFPRAALQLVQSTTAAAGADRGLAAVAAEIQAESGVDLRRWRRLPVAADLAAWRSGGDGEWSADGSAIRVSTEGLTMLIGRDEAPARYRYEATVVPGEEAGDFPVYGIVFGANDATGMRMFALIPEADIVGVVTLKEGPEITENFGPPPEVGEGGLRLAVEVEGRDVVFLADDEVVGKRQLPLNELEGSVGVFAQDVEATFLDLRFLY